MKRTIITPEDLMTPEYSMDHIARGDLILQILKERGFPVKGTLILEMDWHKLKRVEQYQELDGSMVFEWEEKENPDSN